MYYCCYGVCKLFVYVTSPLHNCLYKVLRSLEMFALKIIILNDGYRKCHRKKQAYKKQYKVIFT